MNRWSDRIADESNGAAPEVALPEPGPNVVFRPIGDVLVACRVETTPTTQHQLRRLRDWHPRWDGDPPRGFRRLRGRIRSGRS